MLNINQENRQLYTISDSSPDFDQDRARLLMEWLHSIKFIKRSLDVGCGRGGFSSLLPETVEKWGVDFERHPNLPEKFIFYSRDIAESWSLPENYFDVVFAGEVIEHVLDTDFFLEQCFKVMCQNGYLLLTTPNLSSFANLRYWLQTDQFMWVDSGINQFGHVRYLAPKRLKMALSNAGFEDIQMKSVAGFESLKIFPYIYQIMQRAFPLRGNRLCAIARKRG